MGITVFESAMSVRGVGAFEALGSGVWAGGFESGSPATNSVEAVSAGPFLIDRESGIDATIREAFSRYDNLLCWLAD